MNAKVEAETTNGKVKISEFMQADDINLNWQQARFADVPSANEEASVSNSFDAISPKSK